MESGMLSENAIGMDRPLIAYAFLAQARSDTTDLMSGLAPIFSPIAKQLQGKQFVADVFAKKVEQIYGIKIHPWAAEDLAPRLAACGVLTKDCVTENAIGYTYATPPSRIEIDEVTEAQIRALLLDFSTYAREQFKRHGLNLADEEAEQVFLAHLVRADFTRSRAHRATKSDPNVLSLSNRKNDEDDGLESAAAMRRAHLDVICAAYILRVLESNPAGYDLIVRVAHGALLSEVVLNVQSPDSKIDMRRLTVILDAPLVMSILDLRAPESTEYARAFIRDLGERGCFLKIFNHSIEEMEYALKSVIQSVGNGNGHGATARRLMKGGSFKPYLDSVVADVRGAISRYDISAIEAPHSVNSLQYFSEEDESEAFSSLGFYSNHQAQVRDAKSIAGTVRLRRGVTTSLKAFADASYVFVTENDRVAEKSSFVNPKNKHRAKPVPAALTDRFFAGLMWVTFGGKTNEMTHHRLLANCVAALEPNSDVLSRVQKFLAELDDEKAAHFRALMTEDRAGQHVMQLTMGDALLVRSTEDASDLLAKIEERQYEKHKRLFDDALASRDVEHNERERVLRESAEREQNEIKRAADGEVLKRDLELMKVAAGYARRAGKRAALLTYLAVFLVLIFVAFIPILINPTYVQGVMPYVLGIGVLVTLVGFWKLPDAIFGKISRWSSERAFETRVQEYKIGHLLGRCSVNFDNCTVSFKDEGPNNAESGY